MAWWPGEGNVNDLAGANHGTLQGGATANAPGVTGSAFSFDGTNGYVQIADAPAFHPAMLTIEAWVNFSSLDSAGSGPSPGEQYIVFKQNSQTLNFEGFYLGKTRISNQDHLTFQASSAAGQNVEADSTSLVNTGVWYHVAGVRGSNFLQLYVNGQLESQTTVSFPQDYGVLPLFFGTSGQPSWDRKLSGRLDEVSLYDRPLAAAEIAAIYAAGAAGKCQTPRITAQPQSQTAAIGAAVNFSVTASGNAPLSYQWQHNGADLSDGDNVSGATSPLLGLANVQTNDGGDYQVVVTNLLGAVTSSVATLTVITQAGCQAAPSGLIGWWPGYGNGQDIVGTNNAILQSGALDGTPGFVGTAFNFDGTNGYAQIPNAPELNPTNLTVECWVRFDRLDSEGSNPQGNAYLVFKQNTRSTVFEGINLAKHREPAGEIIVWEVSSAAGQAVQLNSISQVTTGVWYHVAGVRGSNYSQLYINGQLEAQGTVNFPQDYGDYPLYFGTSGQPYWDRRLAGSLDEVSLYNRALSADEIAAIYAAGSAGKCQGSPAILTPPQGGVRYLGGSITFTSAVAGALPLSFQWQKDGSPIPDATYSSLVLSNLQWFDAASYALQLSNTFGSVTSAPAVLIVKEAGLAINLTGSSGDVVTLTIGGLSGQSYGIQSCDNLTLANWQGQTNLFLSSPLEVWSDPRPKAELERYYRVVLGPIPIP